MTTGSGLNALVKAAAAQAAGTSIKSEATTSKTSFLGGGSRVISWFFSPITSALKTIASLVSTYLFRDSDLDTSFKESASSLGGRTTVQQSNITPTAHSPAPTIAKDSKTISERLQEVKIIVNDTEVASAIVALLQKNKVTQAFAKIDGFSEGIRGKWNEFCFEKLKESPQHLGQARQAQVRILQEFCGLVGDKKKTDKKIYRIILDILDKPEVDRKRILQLASFLSEEGNRRYEEFVEEDTSFYPPNLSEEEFVLLQLRNFCFSESAQKIDSELLAVNNRPFPYGVPFLGRQAPNIYSGLPSGVAPSMGASTERPIKSDPEVISKVLQISKESPELLGTATVEIDQAFACFSDAVQKTYLKWSRLNAVHFAGGLMIPKMQIAFCEGLQSGRISVIPDAAMSVRRVKANEDAHRVLDGAPGVIGKGLAKRARDYSAANGRPLSMKPAAG
ncbi:MAG: hypothetical protein P0S96_01085 [Simkaniaceae bacterium]|nr:hypothetical protein [Candidatus Sacchlamyda saccharinae]